MGALQRNNPKSKTMVKLVVEEWTDNGEVVLTKQFGKGYLKDNQ